MSDYPTPTGIGFGVVGLLYKDDRRRLAGDAEPLLVRQVTQRVAADLRSAVGNAQWELVDEMRRASSGSTGYQAQLDASLIEDGDFPPTAVDDGLISPNDSGL